jgi:membrane protease subunit HflK
MSDVDVSSGGQGAAPSGPVESGRTTSVRFDNAAGGSARADMGARMDAANQSLADALRITFRIVQAAMVLLVALFVFSGFKTVKEGERGVSIRLGKAVESNIEPGPHLTWPYPVGEMVTVGTGTVEVRLDRDFFPYQSGSNPDPNVPVNELSNTSQLDPARDGSLITADLNLAHAQWTVNYRRTDHQSYVSNIVPSEEQDIVRVAVRRGVIQAVAETTIDDLLKDRDVVPARAREIAQRSLDQIGAGIDIESLVLNRKFAPVFLLDRFARVQSAAQEAGQARETAESSARTLLNGVAGPAADLLAEQIDAYERAIELGQPEEAEVILARIDGILEGQPVDLGGQVVQPEIAGEVSELIKSAANDAYSRREQARAQAELFKAKLAQYRTNPGLTLTREWTEAFRAFTRKDFVQAFVLPEGTDLDMFINQDPTIIGELDRAQKRREAEQAREQREQEFRRMQYQTERGVREGEDL